MAEGFLKSLDPRLEVHSAGTELAPRVNPFAVQVMEEIGIDISAGYPKKVDRFINQSFDHVITVCDGADRSCPNFHGTVGQRVHIGFPDPAGSIGSDEEKLDAFRAVRDEIRKRFRDYYESEIRKGL